ncbi:centromere/kinetochore protein zw10 homolog [Patiria miniata]|uniref:Uncharacterized protein n=1 Tax=Patiria miniata TaxID=46514 RepID=A0A914BIF2_PATMI|nr:centromere/kinetochore protein zw10 homolog [Patiria miniata]
MTSQTFVCVQKQNVTRRKTSVPSSTAPPVIFRTLPDSWRRLTLSLMCYSHYASLLTDFQSFVQNNEFLQAADAVNELKSDLDVLIEDGYCELKIVKALRSEQRVNQETLLHHLGEAWSAMTVWTIPHAKEPVTLTNVSQVQLKLVHSENASVTANAMSQVGILKSKM